MEKISVTALVLLITGAIDSIRNLPTTAIFGASLIFFFFFAAIVFLIPVALVSAELASTWSEEEGGIYSWVRYAFGEKWAFMAIWLQWINTMVWYQAILLFIAGVIAYLVNPALAHNKWFLVITMLTIFWGLTFVGLSGIRASASVASFCAIFGMILPMALIIGLAIYWVVQGYPLAIKVNAQTLLPQWTNQQSWVSLTAIITSFLGMELAAVHVRNIHNPQKNFPKAIFYSVVLILTTMILGSLAIAFVLPKHQISLIDGVMQAFSSFFQAYHLTPFIPVIIVLLLIGSLGSMINWIISPAKGLMLASENGFLPGWLHQLNRHGVASRILLLQALLVTLLCGVYAFLPSVDAIYWLFTDLSTELYVLMYILMFAAAIHLKSKFAMRSRHFAIPGGKIGYYLTCILGLVGCIIAFIVGFIPPEESIDIGNKHTFLTIFISGMACMLLPTIVFYWYKARND